MRITVHLKDSTEQNLRTQAENEHRSVSSLVTEAVDYYIQHKRRKEQGSKMFNLIGTAKVRTDAHHEINKGREDDDRA